jgi:hypothetical protein
MRIRDDKPDANHISVVENIIKTIIEPVHQKDVRDPLISLFSPRSQHLSSVAYQRIEPLTHTWLCSSSTEGRSSEHAGRRVRRPLAHQTRRLPNRIPTRISHDSKGTNSSTRLHLTATHSEAALPWCAALSRRVRRRWVCKGLWTSGSGWVDSLVGSLRRLETLRWFATPKDVSLDLCEQVSSRFLSYVLLYRLSKIVSSTVLSNI